MKLIKVSAIALLALVPVAFFASPAGADINTWQWRTHPKSDCTMWVATGYSPSTGQVNAAGTVKCTKRHASSKVKVQLKVDGQEQVWLTKSSTFTNSYGFGDRVLYSGYEGLTGPGCHTYQSIATVTIDGVASYVTTGTPNTMCV